MSLPSRIAPFALAAVVLGSPTGAQSAPLAAQPNLFVPPAPPGNPASGLSCAPLSEFATTTGAGSVELHVNPAVMASLDAGGASVMVAVDYGGGPALDAPTLVQLTGTVEYVVSGPANVVVVSPSVYSVFPIVTHWRAPNGDRGGQQVGATDRLMTLDYDNVTHQVVYSGSIKNEDDCYRLDVGATYYFNTKDYALFSDGSEANPESLPANAKVPAYERYVGETYSILGPTNLAATWLSDQVRQQTGYPVVYRNQPDAFDPSASPELQVAQGLPAFLVVNAHIVDIGDMYPGVVGSENSLATFLLPPGWTADPPAGSQYPIFFNGDYDLNESTFARPDLGLHWLTVLGTLHDEGKQVVGILWNGGGGLGPVHAIHRSFYDNAAQLIDDAVALLGADRHRIITKGGSRGGTTALSVTANPYYPDGAPHSYTVLYAIAEQPHVRLGEAATKFANPTYSLIHSTLISFTGFQEASEVNWEHPVTGQTASQLALFNLTNSENPSVVDSNLSNDSPVFLDAMLERWMLQPLPQRQNGPQIVLRAGTHDFSRPLHHVLEYAEHLRDRGVPVQLDIHHRAGHTTYLSPAPVPDDTELLRDAFTVPTNEPIPGTTEHFRPDPNVTPPVNSLIYGEHIQAQTFPLVFECPLQVEFGASFTMNFVGEPGTSFVLSMSQVSFDPSTSCTVSGAGTFVPLAQGTLPTGTGRPFAQTDFFLTIPGSGPLQFAYRLDYDVPGLGPQPTLGDCAFPIIFECGKRRAVMFLRDQGTAPLDLDNFSRTGGLDGDVNHQPQ